MPKKKTLKINPDTHARLIDYAKKGESFDDAINRLLDDFEEYKQFRSMTVRHDA